MPVIDQRKGHAFWKRLWYSVFGVLTVCGTVGLAGGVVSCIATCLAGASVTIGGSTTIGIIGGADGPTAVYVAASPWKGYIISAVALVTGVVGVLVLSRRHKK